MPSLMGVPPHMHIRSPPQALGKTGIRDMQWPRASGTQTLWSFWIEMEPLRFCEMELPLNQFSCVATRGVPRLLRCFGEVRGDAFGDLFGDPLLRSMKSCSTVDLSQRCRTRTLSGDQQSISTSPQATL